MMRMDDLLDIIFIWMIGLILAGSTALLPKDIHLWQPINFHLTVRTPLLLLLVRQQVENQ
tara:strand:+ start:588 stop:767 length:180 start_codon:yes stop_codon:yes gene_type:complete